jgi:peptidoglycan/xylan/chitin deacetylase (PgdA/CDA1 family)
MFVISAALRAAGAVVSPGGRNGCLTILTYHRVMPENDPLLPFDQMDAICFDKQMSAVSEHFNVLPLGDAVDMLRQNKLPRRALSITFDDGYLDNHSVAWPILRHYGLPATFFVSTAYLNGGLMFNDVLTEALRRANGDRIDLSWLGLGVRSVADNEKKCALNTDLVKAVKYMTADDRQLACDRVWSQIAGDAARPWLMMAPDHIRDLASVGMTIGGHTHTHPILNRISLADARQDIVDNRESLRDITGRYPDLFAYPNGKPGTDYANEHVQLVKELGYGAAVTTACGVASPHADLFQLPRFSPWNHTSTRFVLHLLRNAWAGRQPVTV